MRYFTLLVLTVAGSLSLGLGCYEDASGSGSGSASGSDEGPAATDTIYATCVSDAQCDPSETCLDNGNVCTTECEEDRDCPEAPGQAQICLEGQCVVGCLTAGETCPQEQFCADSGPTPFFCRAV